MMIWEQADYELSNKAEAEWKKTHLCDPSFKTAFAYYYKGKPIVVFYREADEAPWSVQYAGNGHYFKTKDEALAFFEERAMKEQKKIHNRREYTKKYYKEHKDKMKEYRHNSKIRAAIKYLNEHPEEMEKLKAMKAANA